MWECRSHAFPPHYTTGSMSSAADDCKATVPSDHNVVFCSSMPLDIPVVSTHCSSLDETVCENSFVPSLSTYSLSQDLISDSASRDLLDCNHPQNSIHVSQDCTESHSSNSHNSVGLRSVPPSCQAQ